MGELGGSLTQLRESNRALALAARKLLAEILEVPLPAPESMVGSLGSLRIPARRDGGEGPDPLYLALFEERFRVPVFPWRGRVLRVSAQCYNDLSDYEALGRAVKRFLSRESGASV
jgi:isopenicillin-N epimerase